MINYPKVTRKTVTKAYEEAIKRMGEDATIVATSRLAGFWILPSKIGHRVGYCVTVDVRKFSEEEDLASIERQLLLPRIRGINKNKRKLKIGYGQSKNSRTKNRHPAPKRFANLAGSR